MIDIDYLFEYQEYENDTFQYLIYLLDNEDTQNIHDFLIHSEMLYALDMFSVNRNDRKLKIISDPDIFKKYYSQFNELKQVIKKKIFDISSVNITTIKIEPNLKKFQISENRYVPVLTPWEEINNAQNNMLEQFRKASESIDYQNIGNTCRTIMQKISNIVFDLQKHIAPSNIDVSEGKFKNRLHTYIKTELGGRDNEEIRDYSLSIINTAEKAIDLANTLTHSLNADSFISESCVVSTISAINIVRIIEKNKNANGDR